LVLTEQEEVIEGGRVEVQEDMDPTVREQQEPPLPFEDQELIRVAEPRAVPQIILFQDFPDHYTCPGASDVLWTRGLALAP
jgi:hypothetical protein